MQIHNLSLENNTFTQFTDSHTHAKAAFIPQTASNSGYFSKC